MSPWRRAWPDRAREEGVAEEEAVVEVHAMRIRTMGGEASYKRDDAYVKAREAGDVDGEDVDDEAYDEDCDEDEDT